MMDIVSNVVDRYLALRVAARFLASNKTVKVKNRDTGEVVWKTPEALQGNPQKYQKLPQPYQRNPKGRPHRPEHPGKETLPARMLGPKPKKPPKPKKLPKLPVPVPPIPVVDPPKPPQKRPIPGQKWKHKDSG